MSPLNYSVLLGLLLLPKMKKSRDRSSMNRKMLKESDFNVKILDDELFQAAMTAHGARIKQLKEYETVPVTGKYSGSRTTKLGYKMKEWLDNNPTIIWASDLTHVKKIDDFGLQLLKHWQKMPVQKSSLKSLVESFRPNELEDLAELDLIEDEYWGHNIQVRMIDLSSRTGRKTVRTKEQAIAPVGAIALLEYYKVPYKLEPKGFIPVRLWSDLPQ
jgi:ABC-type transporter Mla MlaB component